MPLIQSAADALPYIDPTPSKEAMESANALIQAELASEDQSMLHPSIPTGHKSNFSDLITAEHTRLEAGGEKVGAIDLSRYEALDAPEGPDPDAWREVLRKAYASLEYLRGRQINLSLLETYGKNAWLIGNNLLENILRELEREVEAAKLELENVEQERKRAQNSMAGEMKSLEETWRRGVGRMIETQAAAGRLRLQILEQKRAAAT